MNEKLVSIHSSITKIQVETHKRIIGQDILINRILLCLFAGGHILLEGVPGLAKTFTIETIAQTLSLQFQRISFTPDLLPSDLIGNEIYRPQKGEFITRKGPTFTNILLADEINRTPAKVQSALLEAMQQKQVTIGDTTYPLPSPFFVLATQNPIEQEGTYPLPEAQLDRFLMKVLVTYPNRDDEILLMKQAAHLAEIEIQSMLSAEEILQIHRDIDTEVYMDDKIYEYIANIIEKTRTPDATMQPYILYGASPRASIAFVQLAKVYAVTNNRDYVTPDDIKDLSHDILRHRIGLTYEAIGDNISPDAIIQHILDNTLVP